MTGVLFKRLGEITVIGKTHIQGDPADGQFCSPVQIGSGGDSVLTQIVGEATAEMLPEFVAELGDFHIQMVTNGSGGNIFLVVLV